MPFFSKASKKSDKLHKKIKQARQALHDQQSAELAEKELRSVVEQQQEELKRLKQDVPELEKQLKVAQKINRGAQKEAKAIARTTLRAIKKDPVMKIQRALESQHRAGEMMERTKTSEDSQKTQPATNPQLPPPYAEGRIAASFTAAMYPALHTTEPEKHSEEPSGQNDAPPNSSNHLEDAMASLRRMDGRLREARELLNRLPSSRRDVAQCESTPNTYGREYSPTTPGLTPIELDPRRRNTAAYETTPTRATRPRSLSPVREEYYDPARSRVGGQSMPFPGVNSRRTRDDSDMPSVRTYIQPQPTKQNIKEWLPFPGVRPLVPWLKDCLGEWRSQNELEEPLTILDRTILGAMKDELHAAGRAREAEALVTQLASKGSTWARALKDLSLMFPSERADNASILEQFGDQFKWAGPRGPMELLTEALNKLGIDENRAVDHSADGEMLFQILRQRVPEGVAIMCLRNKAER